MSLATDALRDAQRSFLEQYDERVGYEYRAAYRRDYDYLWVRMLPTSMGTVVQFTHADQLCGRVMDHFRMFEVNESAVEEIKERMNDQ
jgi:hypothetical protein